MLVTRQVINDFRELVADKQNISDHNGWSHRLVYHHLRNARARLLYEKLHDKKKLLSSHVYQTIPCIPLIEVDTTECPCTPKLGCMFMRTKYPIPKPIGQLSVVATADLKGVINYNYLDWDKFKWRLDSRYEFTQKSKYYTWRSHENGMHIYIYNDEYRKFITVTGVFEDPLDVYFFPDCAGNEPPCKDPLARPFLMDADLVPTMYSLTLSTLMQTKGQLLTDKTQDAFDTPPPDQSRPAK